VWCVQVCVCMCVCVCVCVFVFVCSSVFVCACERVITRTPERTQITLGGEVQERSGDVAPAQRGGARKVGYRNSSGSRGRMCLDSHC